MTHDKKIKKIMQDFSCSRKSAMNIWQMLDWITEKESTLIALHKEFIKGTGSTLPFNEFCYGLWPQCKAGYLAAKKRPQWKDPAIKAQR